MARQFSLIILSTVEILTGYANIDETKQSPSDFHKIQGIFAFVEKSEPSTNCLCNLFFGFSINIKVAKGSCNYSNHLFFKFHSNFRPTLDEPEITVFIVFCRLYFYLVFRIVLYFLLPFEHRTGVIT